jgi:hypothetical protein
MSAPALPPGAFPRHATAVARDGRALLLEGPSGCGKSDLALRLIDRGWLLVADDQVIVAPDDAGGWRAAAPPTLAGLLEVRGVGLVRLPFAPWAQIALILDLAAEPPRLPEPAADPATGLPRLALRPFEPSAPLKAERAFAAVRAGLGCDRFRLNQPEA